MAPESLVSHTATVYNTTFNHSRKHSMAIKTLSRGTNIDLEKCVSMTGNNRYNLVLMASARARELVSIQRQRDWATHVNAPVQALLDVQQGLVGPEYLRKVR